MSHERALRVFGDRLESTAVLAARTNKATVLVVQQFPVAEDHGALFPLVRESIANIMAFVELGAAHDLSWVLDAAGSAFNWVVVDCDHKLPASAEIVAMARSRVPDSQLLFYSDNQVWFDSGLDMVQRLERGLTGKRVVICGSGTLADCFAAVLPRIGAIVVGPDEVSSVPDVPLIVLGLSQKKESVDSSLVERLAARSSIYDIGIGNLSLSTADLGRSRGLAMYRLDNRAGVSSAVVRLLETDYMVGKLMGQLRLKDTDIVAGGLLAPAGAVIVDDIRNPTWIFGIADGKGRFKEPLDPGDCVRLDFVRVLLRLSTPIT